jgi:hypothetical protein
VSTAPKVEVALVRPLAFEMDSVRSTLDVLASELRTMWSAALAEEDFATIDRLAEASHSVHRAAVALTEDALVPDPGGSHPVRA